MEHRASSEIAKKSFVRSPAVAEESLRNGFQTLRRGDRVSYAGEIKWSTPSCSPTPNLQTSTPSCSPTPTCDGAATALVPRPVRHDDASLRPTGHEPPTEEPISVARQRIPASADGPADGTLGAPPADAYSSAAACLGIFDWSSRRRSPEGGQEMGSRGRGPAEHLRAAPQASSSAPRQRAPP